MPLETVAYGGTEKVRLNNPQACPDCKGSGAKPGTSPRQCAACNGTGRKVTAKRETNILFQTSTTCSDCRGHGSMIDEPCPKCGGLGEVPREDAIEITIPPGVEEGMVLRVPGRGMPARQPQGVPGDLYVRISSAADSRFTRAGADLWREEAIPVADAVLGTTLKIATLHRFATVHVPAGTQPGTILRLRGKGLPEFGGAGKGDLLLRIGVKVPERLSMEERNLYEQLHKIGAARSFEVAT